MFSPSCPRSIHDDIVVTHNYSKLKLRSDQTQWNRISNVYILIFIFIFLLYLQDDITDKAIKLTARERRFIKFASVDFDGQIYMTPQDFLESVVEQEPRREYIIFIEMEKGWRSNQTQYINTYLRSFPARLKRKTLNVNEINNLKEVTPNLKHGSSQLFRSLRDKGKCM